LLRNGERPPMKCVDVWCPRLMVAAEVVEVAAEMEKEAVVAAAAEMVEVEVAAGIVVVVVGMTVVAGMVVVAVVEMVAAAAAVVLVVETLNAHLPLNGTSRESAMVMVVITTPAAMVAIDLMRPLGRGNLMAALTINLVLVSFDPKSINNTRWKQEPLPRLYSYNGKNGMVEVD